MAHLESMDMDKCGMHRRHQLCEAPGEVRSRCNQHTQEARRHQTASAREVEDTTVARPAPVLLVFRFEIRRGARVVTVRQMDSLPAEEPGWALPPRLGADILPSI